MQSGAVIYFDDLIELSEAFAKKVKYDSVLHREDYSFCMEEDFTVLANRDAAFYLEEGKVCFTVPYDSAYEIEWIMLDDIKD